MRRSIETFRAREERPTCYGAAGLWRRLMRRLGCCLAAVFALSGLVASAATAQVIYNDLPMKVPDWASVGNEGSSSSEIGSRIKFGGAGRFAGWLRVGFSSEACQEGTSYEGNCRSASGAYFRWPVEITVYRAGPDGTVGERLWNEDLFVFAPYRPSASKRCTGAQAGEWYDARQGRCFLGKAFTESVFAFRTEVPEEVIISLRYNTTHQGPHPVGDAPCDHTSAGCPYDALNVALVKPEEDSRLIGSNPEPLYFDTTDPETACGDSEDLGRLAPAGSCWDGYQLALSVRARSTEPGE